MSEEISGEDSPCPTTALCHHAGHQYESTLTGRAFPTEAVLGGTLGGLSVIVIGLILYAVCRHWGRGRRRRSSLCHRNAPHRKRAGSALFGDRLFAYGVDALAKPWHSCSHMQPDVYIARPFASDRRQLIQRQVLAAMLDSPDDSSDRDFRSRPGGRAAGGGGGGMTYVTDGT